MKPAKKLLTLLLTLALAFSLALPAAAVDWDDFRITKQPRGLTIQKGESFTLSVEVTIPVGVEVEYTWYGAGARRIENAAASELHLGPNDSAYPSLNTKGERRASYYCNITAYEKDTGGTVISSKTLNSVSVAVTVEKTFWDKIYDITVEPFVYAGIMTLAGMMMSMGFLIPLSPFYFLFFLAEGFVTGFKGLFS